MQYIPCPSWKMALDKLKWKITRLLAHHTFSSFIRVSTWQEICARGCAHPWANWLIRLWVLIDGVFCVLAVSILSFITKPICFPHRKRKTKEQEFSKFFFVLFCFFFVFFSVRWGKPQNIIWREVWMETVRVVEKAKIRTWCD